MVEEKNVYTAKDPDVDEFDSSESDPCPISDTRTMQTAQPVPGADGPSFNDGEYPADAR